MSDSSQTSLPSEGGSAETIPETTPATETTPTVTELPTSTQLPPDSQSDSPSEPPPSYVKLAMRNMVRKRGTSLYHFALTTIGLLGFLIGLAYLTR